MIFETSINVRYKEYNDTYHKCQGWQNLNIMMFFEESLLYRLEHRIVVKAILNVTSAVDDNPSTKQNAGWEPRYVTQRWCLKKVSKSMLREDDT